MTPKKRWLACGIVDGLTRGLLMFVLCEFVVSGLFSKTYIVDLYASLFCFLVYVTLFLLHTHYNKEHLLRFYLIGQAVFALCVVVTLTNYIELHLLLFPRKPLENIDGLFLLLSQAIYLFPSGIIRLVILISTRIINISKRNSTKQGKE